MYLSLRWFLGFQDIWTGEKYVTVTFYRGIVDNAKKLQYLVLAIIINIFITISIT